MCNSYEDISETICRNAMNRGIASSSVEAGLTKRCKIYDELRYSVAKYAMAFGLDAEQECVKEPIRNFLAGSDDNSDTMVNTTTNNGLGGRLGYRRHRIDGVVE